MDPRTISARAARWAWLIVLGSGLVLFEIINRALIQTGNPNLVPSLIIVGAATIPLSCTIYLAQRTPLRTLTAGTVLAIATAGGIAGLVSASLLEQHQRPGGGPGWAVSVGAIEEAAKLAVPLIVVTMTRNRLRLTDGFVIAVASGAAFAALETMGYAAQTFLQSPGREGLGQVNQTLLWRGLLSPAGHLAWTGLAATAMWWAVQRRWAPRATVRFAGAFALAVGLHAVWDTVDNTITYILLAATNLLLLAYTARRARIGTELCPPSHVRPEPDTVKLERTTGR